MSAWQLITDNKSQHIKSGRILEKVGPVYMVTSDKGRVIGQTSVKANVPRLMGKRLPEQQTIEQWLSDYEESA